MIGAMETDTRTSGATDRAADERALLEVVGGLLAEVGDGRGIGRISLDAALDRDLGLGSLERVELLSRVEARFGVRLPETAFADATTPRQLLALVARRRGHAPPLPGAAAAAAPGALTDGPAAAPPPEKARTLVEALEYRATRDADRVHLLLVREDGAEEPLTFAALRREAGAVAAALREIGVAPRAGVAIMLPTCRGYFAAFMGALLAGAVPVPIYPPFRLDRIAEYIARQSKILENAGAEVLVTFERAARIGEIARDRVPSLRRVVAVEALLEAGERAGGGATIGAAVGPDDLALVQYTSGSTADPKGVELTHANVLANVRAAAAAVALTPDDVVVSWLPLYHDMGLIAGWLLDLYAGSRCVLLSPLSFLSRPAVWLETITRYRATRSVAPNFAFDLCARRVNDEALAGLDLRSLRTVLNGSEPIQPESLVRFCERFAPCGFRPEALFPAYGLAENMVAVAFPPLDRAPRIDTIERGPFLSEGRAVPATQGAADVLRFVAVGRPLPGNEVRIVGEDGAERGERREGRLHFRGPSTFRGYRRNPEATARVKLAGGWVDSGDLAYHADGELFITGRVKDLIIKGGRNYYPHEIEAAAGAVPGVRQGCVAAFGTSDPARGTEAIVVVAETREENAAAREALAGRVGDAVAAAVGVPPDRVVLVGPGAVPKTSSGKIRRSETRQRYLAGALAHGDGSFARQAAGLVIAGLPARARAAVRRAGEVASGAYAAGVLGTSLFVGVALGLATPAGRPLRRLTAALARAALALAGMSPRARGLERLPPGAAILVANHASYLDMFLLAAVLPDDVRYVVKGEVRGWPVIGRLLGRAGHLLVDRYVPERSLEGLREAAALLRRGGRLLIFPEGTFLAEVGLRPFKLGAFRLACETGAPLVPMAIRGTRRALRDGMWLPRRARLELEVLDPIPPEGQGMAEMVRLRDAAADAIASKIDEPRLAPVAVAG
jgi:1-acyl-sn-glycerol-3-phosphate acyltransferase